MVISENNTWKIKTFVNGSTIILLNNLCILPHKFELSSLLSSQSGSPSHCHLEGMHLPSVQRNSAALQDIFSTGSWLVKKRKELVSKPYLFYMHYICRLFKSFQNYVFACLLCSWRLKRYGKSHKIWIWKKHVHQYCKKYGK